MDLRLGLGFDWVLESDLSLRNPLPTSGDVSNSGVWYDGRWTQANFNCNCNQTYAVMNFHFETFDHEVKLILKLKIIPDYNKTCLKIYVQTLVKPVNNL